MKQNNRVFVTGLSALTASGLTLDDTWSSLLAGHSAIKKIQRHDISSWPCQLGAELTDFQPAKMLPDKKLIKAISTQDAFGIVAASQAMNDSKLMAFRDSLADATEFNDKTGVYVGSPGNKYCQQYDFLPLLTEHGTEFKGFAENLFNVVHPMWLLRILPNNVLAYTGITYQCKGINHNVSNHAVSGMQALIEAYHAIAQGFAERVIVVAYDLGLEPQGLFYYDALGVLSHKGLYSFDERHDGTVLGEGAAALVLESEASVNARHATPYAEIHAGKSHSEAHGLFSIEDDGKHLASLVADTLEASSLTADDIDFVVAHANGNPKSDLSESRVIQQLFDKVPVTGFKWSMGHTLAASGLLDAVLAVKSCHEGVLPGIATLQSPASECASLNVSSSSRPIAKNSNALIINRGFGSMNATLVVSGCA